MEEIPDFRTVAARRSPGLDELALAMAAELRPVDAASALAELLDPFAGGAPLEEPAAEPAHVRPWGPHETALRMLNNVVASYARRGDLRRAIRAAELRLALPLEERGHATLAAELTALQARLN